MKKVITDLATNETYEVDFTEQEMAEALERYEFFANLEKELQKSAEAKLIAQEKLKALGLTKEDLEALGL